MKIALIAHDRKKELMVKMVTLIAKSWHSINYMPQEQQGNESKKLRDYPFIAISLVL